MRFSGRLQLEADPLNWLRTDLLLSSGRLELTAGSEVLGSWATSQVKASRVEGDRFELHLGDDRAVFAADDALAFSYEAMPVLTKRTVFSAASGLRGKLRKGLNSLERPEEVEAEAATPVMSTAALHEPGPANDPQQSPLGPTARKLRELMAAAKGAQVAQGVVVAEHGAEPVTTVAPPALGSPDQPAVVPAPGDPPRSEFGSEDPPWEGALDFLSTVATLEEIPDDGAAPPPPMTAPAPFDWARDGDGTVVTTTRSRLVVALEDLIEEVQAGSMSVSQIEAITRLVEAVGKILERHSAD